jgi:tetratricopeptide (TPR) repeat protein
MILGAYFAEEGREAELEALIAAIREAEVEVQAEGRAGQPEVLTLVANAIDAYGWARNGNPTEREAAILDLRDLQGTGLAPDVWIKWWLGELYAEDGRPREASVYLEALRGSGVPYHASYLLGKVYTELGEREKARDAYVRFLQAWEEADPDLPQLEEARTALEELLAG